MNGRKFLRKAYSYLPPCISLVSEKHLDRSDAILTALSKSKQSIRICVTNTTTHSVLSPERDYLKYLYLKTMNGLPFG